MAKYLDELALSELVSNIKALIATKQDTLTFDTTPTSGSSNPVTSGGIYNALTGNGISSLSGKGLSSNDYTSTEKSKLAGIASGAQVNTIESIKSGSTVFTPDANKAVDIQGVNNLTNYYTTSNTYNKTEINAMVSSVYKPAGSVSFANLPTLSASVLGNVYNVTDAFTTTNDFVEGAGKSYPAGTNVVVIYNGSAYLFDVLAGFVDLSGYQQTIDDLSTIRSNASAGKSASDTIATYGDVVTHDASEFQPKIDSSHKVSADLIDDSSATNKFVTASDKSTWNGKQNAITSSNKLSSDLVDDTNHTNKFVTTTEKNTWNGKQDAISDLTTIRNLATTALQPNDNITNLTNNAGYTKVAASATNGYIKINNVDTKVYELPSDVAFTDVANTFTQGQIISRTDSGPILKLTSAASDTNFLLERQGGATCVLESGGSIGLFGTMSNHGLQIRTNYVNRMSFDTSGGVTLATAPAANSNSNQIATTKWVNDKGYITGISSGDVVSALGFTPYNSTNPNGYQTASQVETIVDNRGVRYDISNQGLTSTQQANARTNIGAGTSNFDGLYSSLTGLPTLGTASSKDTGTTSGTIPLIGSNGKLDSSIIPTQQITIDSALSSTSENPVQNKVINSALLDKMDKVNPVGSGSISLNRADNSTVGNYSSTFGQNNTASGDTSFAEGQSNTASGTLSHSEGWQTTASGSVSHSEGFSTTASGAQSHAEGFGTVASGIASHAEGFRQLTTGQGATGDYSHSEGVETTSSGSGSHSEGNRTTASGNYSHASGYYTTSSSRSQFVLGEYNVLDSGGSSTTRGNYVEIVGNGTADNARSNARTLDWNGNEVLAGTLQASGLTDGTTTKTMTEILTGGEQLTTWVMRKSGSNNYMKFATLNPNANTDILVTLAIHRGGNQSTQYSGIIEIRGRWDNNVLAYLTMKWGYVGGFTQDAVVANYDTSENVVNLYIKADASQDYYFTILSLATKGAKIIKSTDNTSVNPTIEYKTTYVEQRKELLYINSTATETNYALNDSIANYKWLVIRYRVGSSNFAWGVFSCSMIIEQNSSMENLVTSDSSWLGFYIRANALSTFHTTTKSSNTTSDNLWICGIN